MCLKDCVTNWEAEYLGQNSGFIICSCENGLPRTPIPADLRTSQWVVPLKALPPIAGAPSR